MASVLRDYQAAMVDSVQASVRSGHRRLYTSMPTGTGKTRTAAELVASSVQGSRRVMWIVHRRELVTQGRDAIAARLGDDPATAHAVVGIVMGGDDDFGADVVVASIASLRAARLQRILDAGPISRVIVDECHHVTETNTYGAVINAIDEHCQEATGKPAVVVGVTATPFRADRQDMRRVLPFCAFERHITDMVRDGWLCELAHRTIQLGSLDLSSAKLVRKLGEVDFADADIAPAVERQDVIDDTVSATAPYLEGRPTVAFTASVYHAQLLALAYGEAGFRAEPVWGAMGDAARDDVIRRWKAGEIDVVTNCAVLTEGFDYPGIAAVVIARPTMSVGSYLQMVGRGTRLAEGKTDCIVLDITGRMPPKAKPIDFSDIIGEDLDEDAASNLRRVKKTKETGAIRLHRIRDPYGRSRFVWTEHPGLPVMFAPVGDRAHAVLIRDERSGLVRPWLVVDRKDARPVGEEQVPLRQAIADVEVSMAANKSLFRKALAHSDQSWRDEAPTGKQLFMLRRMSERYYGLAVNAGWTRGDVSLAIDAIVLEPILRKVIDE